MYPISRAAAHFAVLLFTSILLSACSGGQGDGDLAVAKMSKSQMQATNFLPLNADKPGTAVDVLRYLVPGKYTIVAYLSPYDASCLSFEPQLVQLSQARTDIAVRTVNINRPGVQGVDWQSPIVQEMQIQKLPFFLVFDPAQSVRAKGRPAYEGVVQWLRDMSANSHESDQSSEAPALPN